MSAVENTAAAATVVAEETAATSSKKKRAPLDATTVVAKFEQSIKDEIERLTEQIAKNIEENKAYHERVKELKQLLPMTKVLTAAPKATKRTSPGFKAQNVPAKLLSFINDNLGKDLADDCELTRNQVVDYVHEYAEKSDLYPGDAQVVTITTKKGTTQTLKGKQVMKADAAIAKLFNIKAGDIFTIFNMQTYIAALYAEVAKTDAKPKAKKAAAKLQEETETETEVDAEDATESEPEAKPSKKEAAASSSSSAAKKKGVAKPLESETDGDDIELNDEDIEEAPIKVVGKGKAKK